MNFRYILLSTVVIACCLGIIQIANSIDAVRFFADGLDYSLPNILHELANDLRPFAKWFSIGAILHLHARIFGMGVRREWWLAVFFYAVYCAVTHVWFLYQEPEEQFLHRTTVPEWLVLLFDFGCFCICYAILSRLLITFYRHPNKTATENE